MDKRMVYALLASLLAPCSVAHGQETALPPSDYFDGAKITVNERARADGFLRVRVRPEGGDSREATIAIAKRMSENDIAKGIASALEAALAPDYEVDRDAGEHVKIRKAARGTPSFAVEITFSAPGFSIVLEN